ncbi:unnamed protein product [Linum trigynum]|uniref:DUF4283 domain-containing protein n=1 Tax=Linum trigynum TaxID=586398 RepID=A0AAV2D5V5_9ROSI
MAAVGPSSPLPEGDPKPPDPTAGVRRPPELSSSPDGKKAKEAQHPKKWFRGLEFQEENQDMDEVIIEDLTETEEDTDPIPQSGTPPPQANNFPDNSQAPKPASRPMAWGEGRRKLFSEAVQEVEWYVADSDSEDVDEGMREDDRDEATMEEDNPRCPSTPFTAAEFRKYRREWRSAIVVKILGRSFPYLVVARRLNMLWARNDIIQVTNRGYEYYYVRFTNKLDYEHALMGGTLDAR